MAARSARPAGPAGGPGRRRAGSAARVAVKSRPRSHAERAAIGLLLIVAPELVGDLVPPALDLRHRLLGRDLAGEHPVDGGVEHDLLVALVLRDAQVEHHVRAVQAVADGAEIVLGRLLAHPRLEPQVEVLELRGAVGIEAGDADRHVDVRLLGLADVGQERVGGVLYLGVAGRVDGAGPAAEGRERRVVDAADGVRAGRGVAGDQLAAGAVEDPGRAGQHHRADLVLDLRRPRVDGERADVAPGDRQRAGAGREQPAGVADVQLYLFL